mgnify:CR=1 FL=1
MGTTLTGKRVQNTYDSLLKIGDNDNLTGTPKRVGDGLGNDSPIFLSTTKIGVGVTPTYQLQTSGEAKIGSNLIVGGNLTVNGTTTIIDSTVIAIGDNMMELAKDNVANTMDIGWYGTINSSGEKYVGMFYDASSGVSTPEFHIGLGTSEPSSTASWNTKGKLIIGALDATTGVFNGNVDIIGSLKTDSNIEIQAASGYGFMEIGGPSGGHIDLKKPFSDDYDLRLITGTDSEITASGTLKLNAGNTLTLTLDGSTQNASFVGHISLLDGKELKVGTDVDLKIYHSSGNSFIQNFTGSLVIEQSSGAIALRPKTGENGVLIIEDGAVELYHNNVKKLETTSSGVTITGELELGDGTANKIQFIGGQGNWRMNISNSANQFVIHSESLAADYFTVIGGGGIKLNAYGSGNKTGTIAKNLAVDSSGNIIETDGGLVDGSGTANDVVMWSDSDTLTDAPIAISGNNATFAGNINATKGFFTATNNQISIVDSDDNQDFRLQTNLGKFSIKDHTNSQTIFKIDANSGADSLVISSSGTEFGNKISVNAGTTFDSMVTIQGNESGGQTATFLHLNSGNNTTLYPFLATLNNADISSATYGWLFVNSSVNGNFELYRQNNSSTPVKVWDISRSTGNATFAGDISLEQAATPTIELKDTTNNYYLLVRHNNTNAIFDTHSSSYYEFKIGDVEKMRLTSSAATFAGDIILSNNDVERFIKSSSNGGAIKITGNSDATTNPDRGLFLGRVDNNDVFSASLSFHNGDDAVFSGDVTISKAATPLLKLLDTTNNVSLLIGADDNNTFLRGSSGSLIFQTNGANAALTLDSSQNATFAADIIGAQNFKATGNNMKLFAGGTHVINIDLNKNFYPQTHNDTDIGFSNSLAFRHAYFSGTGKFSNVNASSYQLNGTYIVDSSRNLVNIGTISSTYITTSANINSTGDGGATLGPYRLGFDQAGTRSWTMKATSGFLNVFSGDSKGAFNLGGNLNFAINGGGIAYPDTGGINLGSTGWRRLGRWETGQGGKQLIIHISSGVGYNASLSQQGEITIILRTSNGSSSQTATSGPDAIFMSGYYYQTGYSNLANSNIRVVQVNTSTYDVYMEVRNFLGESPLIAHTSTDSEFYAYMDTSGNTFSGVSYLDLTQQRKFLSETVFSESVGIGINPSRKLQIYNTASQDVALFESTQVFSTLAFKSSTNASTVTIGIDGAGNAAFENKLGTTEMTFVTNGSERMRIGNSNNTNVSIKAKSGTSGNEAALSLLGTNLGSFGGSVIAQSRIDSLTDGTAYGSIMRFYTNNTSNTLTERARISSNGNVGISNQGPTSKIHIGQNSTSGAVDIGLQNNQRHYVIKNGGSGNFVIRDESAASTRIKMDTSGNVGIGLTVTDSKLRINNNGGSSYRFGYGGSSDVYLDIRDLYIRSANGNTNYARFDSNGNFGVGVTSFSERVHIKGGATTRIKVESSGSNTGVLLTENGSDKWSLASVSGTLVAFSETSSATRFSLNSAGTLTIKDDIIAFGSPSDKRLKENIKPIKNALDKVCKLQGVNFDWKQNDSILEIKEDIGFIAQDVQKVLPELVREKDDGTLSLRHQGIVPVLLEAIKELKQEVEELKKQIK